MSTKISRNLAMLAAQALTKELAPLCHKLELAGSIRRLEPLVHDIDIICIPKVEKRVQIVSDYKPALTRFLPVGHELKPHTREVKVNLVEERLNQLCARHVLFFRDKGNGPIHKKIEFYYDRLHSKQKHSDDNLVNIDIWFAEWTNFGIKLLIRTGPAEFSKRFVTFLKYKTPFKAEQGFLKDKESNEVIPVRTEEELAKKIGFRLAKPEDRDLFEFTGYNITQDEEIL